MDDFGVLTEKYGLKPQGKAAPMAAAKRAPNNNKTIQTNSIFESKSGWNSTSTNESLFYDNATSTSSFDAFDDVFGGFQKPPKPSSNSSFAYDFKGSNNSMPNYVDDDIFGGIPGLKTSDSFPSFGKRSDSVDELLGGLNGSGAKWKSWSDNKIGEPKKSASFDDLMPGFGNGNSANHKHGQNIGTSWPKQSTSHSHKSISSASADPFIVLESTSTAEATSSAEFLDQLEQITKPKNSSRTKPGTLRPPPKPTEVVNSDKVKSSGSSVIDELEDFVMGRVPNNAKKHTTKTRKVKERNSAKAGKRSEDGPRENQQKVDDLDSFFSPSFRSSSVPSMTSALDPGSQVCSREGPGAGQKMKPGASLNVKRTSPGTNGVDERVAKALAEMRERDFQSQQEQEERRRISELMDAEIKRWAAGKEGNMRALLSSLQYVLWPECGWQPVSLTDLITSSSVKKVYQKAQLYVHPDKVQQKGANLQQKYIAEKVFDILKEAWKKFSKEELS